MTIVHNFFTSGKIILNLSGTILLFLILTSCSSNDEMPDQRLVEKELYDQAQNRLKEWDLFNSYYESRGIGVQISFWAVC